MAVFENVLSAEEIQRYVEEKETLYRKLYAPQMKPMPGLMYLLQVLSDRHVPLGVATSAPPENIDFVMAGLGLGHYFGAVVNSTEVRHGKPDPEMFYLAAAKLSIMPKRCVVIEDSIIGIQAGKNAGMRVVGIGTTHTPAELAKADLVISDFTELSFEKLAGLFV